MIYADAFTSLEEIPSNFDRLLLMILKMSQYLPSNHVKMITKTNGIATTICYFPIFKINIWKQSLLCTLQYACIPTSHPMALFYL